MNDTVDLQVRLSVLDCCECGITFAVPVDWHRDKRRDHKTIYCPRGHRFHYPGESDLARARRELASARDMLDTSRDQAAHLERRRRGERAAKTRLKNRIANGVCPCCNRSFIDLKRHMDSQHPEFTDQMGGAS